MQDGSKGYKVVATKISSSCYERLNKIARKKGMSVYNLIQMVCDTLVRYMDDRHNLSPAMEQAMSIFEHMDGWKGAFNLADHSTAGMVAEATYFIGDERKHGKRAVHVEKPFMGTWTQTVNIQQIVERTMELVLPERYRRLRMLAVDMDCMSILELLDKMIDFHAKDIDLQMMRKEFEDADRSEFGRKPKEDGPYRRKHFKGVDMFVKEETESADDTDHRQWLEDNAGFTPHGSEW